MSKVMVSSEFENVSPGEYSAVVSLLAPDGTMVSGMTAAVSIPHDPAPVVSQTAPVVTVS